MTLHVLFFLYVATIALTRLVLWFYPQHAPKLGSFQLHHYMYGLLLIVASFLIYQSTLVAIGTALIVDELPLFFIFRGLDWPDDHWKQYHSRVSLATIVAVSLVGYLILVFL